MLGFNWDDWKKLPVFLFFWPSGSSWIFIRPEGGRDGLVDFGFCSVNLNCEIFIRFSYLFSGLTVWQVSVN